jgi:hypothetical protein
MLLQKNFSISRKLSPEGTKAILKLVSLQTEGNNVLFLCVQNHHYNRNALSTWRAPGESGICRNLPRFREICCFYLHAEA